MIFMDLQMPVMDGYEATQTIRASSLPKAQSIPIVAVTADVFKEDVDRCISAGMNEHIRKPLSLQEIINVLRRYLS
jgi:CheY-like chemotaxis protein